MGAVSEFEKDIIKERVVAQLASASRKGKGLGGHSALGVLRKSQRAPATELVFA